VSQETSAAAIVEEGRLVQLGELKMVGFPVIVSFNDGDFAKIGQTKALFLKRKDEIKHAVHTEYYWAPWYSCDVMFTYFYCLQVSELSDIPEGMMGFTIPAEEYVRVAYDGPKPMDPDPYGMLAEHRRRNGLSEKENALIIEKYPFDKDCFEDRLTVEVFGPVIRTSQ